MSATLKPGGVGGLPRTDEVRRLDPAARPVTEHERPDGRIQGDEHVRALVREECRAPRCSERNLWSTPGTAHKPHSVQSGSVLSPSPGVGTALMFPPSGSMMDRPGDENTMWAPSGDQAAVWPTLCVSLRTAEPSGRIT
jgi:hypothetical protein